MNNRSSDRKAASNALAGSALELAAAAEAAVADLETRLPTGMGPVERVEAARIRAAARRLVECAAQLTADELMVFGSTGQRRSHPLLKVEQDLRKEISGSIQKLTFSAEQRAMLGRLNAAHHRRRDKRVEDEAT